MSLPLLGKTVLNVSEFKDDLAIFLFTITQKAEVADLRVEGNFPLLCSAVENSAVGFSTANPFGTSLTRLKQSKIYCVTLGIEGFFPHM